jgi:predicted outer membrane protein
MNSAQRNKDQASSVQSQTHRHRRSNGQVKEIEMNRYAMIACSFATAMSCALAVAHAQTMSTTSKPSKADQTFLKEAIEGDLAEVNMGKLAQEKAESQDAKQFGQMLEQDHGQHLQKAKEMAQQMGVTPPTEPSTQQKKCMINSAIFPAHSSTKNSCKKW